MSGTTTRLSWDVHGQVGCTLTGGNNKNADGQTLNVYVPDAADTIIVPLGRTTYTLTCPKGNPSSVRVDVLPRGFER